MIAKSDAGHGEGTRAEVLLTPRLRLEPVRLELVEAALRRDVAGFEALAGAKLGTGLLSEDLVHRGFGVRIDEIRRDPVRRLWGDRLVLPRDGERRVIGSVVFHGHPDDGVAEVGYGIEEGSRRQGFAVEATRACVAWALSQPGVGEVRATTFAFNVASLKVIESLGMRWLETRDHDFFGELLVFGIDRDRFGAPAADPPPR